MKPYALIVLLLLTWGLVVANPGFASDAAIRGAQHWQQPDSAAATGSLQQYNLLQQLIAQEIIYRLDPLSDLKFSCSFAALSGTTLATAQPDPYPADMADFRVELVVRF